jgi:hypothetical protein
MQFANSDVLRMRGSLLARIVITVIPLTSLCQQQKSTPQISVTAHVEVVSPETVKMGAAAGLRLMAVLTANTGGTLRVRADQICVEATDGRRYCDWKFTQFTPPFRTSAEGQATTIQIDDAFPTVNWVAGNADMMIDMKAGGETVAELLFGGVDWSHAASLRFGPLPAVKVPHTIYDAARNGDLSTVATFLASDPALANSKDTDGQTPLYQAAWRGREDVVRLLLQKGADANSKDRYGETPLHVAANNGRLGVVQVLLANKANVNAKSDSGWTPLHRAALGDQKAVAEVLLAKGADVNAKAQDGRTPLQVAKQFSHADVAELLRQHGGQ